MRKSKDHLLHGILVGALLAFFSLGSAWVSTWGLSPQPADWPRELAKAWAYFLAGLAGGALYSFFTRHSIAPRIGERARAGAIAGAAVGVIAVAVAAAIARWDDFGKVLTAVTIIAFSSVAGALLGVLRPFPGLPPSRGGAT